mmetsp:Transcript_25382/g.59809  ORF Transcript_25382/g.59809 Transcript_25382/m.59809 type:complete len:88 (-) Transcript_25382:89-352(-)
MILSRIKRRSRHPLPMLLCAENLAMLSAPFQCLAISPVIDFCAPFWNIRIINFLSVTQHQFQTKNNNVAKIWIDKLVVFVVQYYIDL